jgi:hypothetical protein
MMDSTSSAFRAERAVSPVDGDELWVVPDPQLILHRQASDFMRCLQGAGRSPHTIRAYAGRVAVFLGWCQAQGVGWRRIGLPDLARFKRWLETCPGRNGRARSGSTVNAILAAVYEFLGSAPGPGWSSRSWPNGSPSRGGCRSPRPVGTPASPASSVPHGAGPSAQGESRNALPRGAFRGAGGGGAGLLPPPAGAVPGGLVAAHRASDR